MSAPREGRQSPEPELQTGNQQQDPPAQGNPSSGAKEEGTKEASEQQKANVLSSNPGHPLDGPAEEKTSKHGRGEGV